MVKHRPTGTTTVDPGRDTRLGAAFWATVRSLFTYFYVFLCMLVVGPVIIGYILITRDLRRPYRWVRWLIRGAMHLAGIRVVVQGREHIPPPPVMFMGNHQSMLDPPLIFLVIPHDIRIFPKKELFRVPILGQLMRIGRFIPVDRQNPERAREQILQSIEMFRQGVSFAIFPEGTRTRTGRLLPFKRGGFVLAITAQIPIVPFSIAGAYELLHKGQWRIRPGTVRIQFHPPVTTRGLTYEDRFDLADRVRQCILRGLPERYHPHPDDTVPTSVSAHRSPMEA